MNKQELNNAVFLFRSDLQDIKRDIILLEADYCADTHSTRKQLDRKYERIIDLTERWVTLAEKFFDFMGMETDDEDEEEEQEEL